MRFEYDTESDGLYIWLVDIELHKASYDFEVRPSELNEEIGLLLSRDKKLLGIEIQPASKYLDVEGL